MRITGQNKTYIYEHMKDSKDPFPQSTRIGRRGFWVKQELHEWVANKVRSDRGISKDGSKDGLEPDTYKLSP